MTDPSASIIQDGAKIRDVWDKSMLDIGVPYPADMAGLPTSTPNPGNLRRKSRRSWFETTPKGMKIEIAVEKNEANVKRTVKPQTGDVETLTLTHFTAAPRLGFGEMKPGQVKVSTLRLRNPHDYDQAVKVEKVPEKKHFEVSCKEFTVGAGEVYPLEVTWSPTETGAFREMILMQVDQSYRLQAYVFGTVVAPPQKKKTRRVGLLASKASRPFSVIHTTSLANINQQYSPEKKSSQSRVKKLQAQSKVVRSDAQSKEGKTVIQTNTNRKRKSGEGKRKSLRLSGKFEDGKNRENKNSPRNNNIEEDLENIKPETFTKFQQPLSRTSAPQVGRMQNKEERVPRKKMRRSNTYSNVSGLGLTVPIIHGETMQGLQDTSLLNIDNCDISGIQPLDVASGIRENDLVTNIEELMTASVKLDTENLPNVNNHEIDMQEPSFIEATDRVTVEQVGRCGLLEPSFLEDRDGSIKLDINDDYKTFNSVAKIEQPSFIECSADIVKTESKTFPNPVLAAAKKEEIFHDSLDDSQSCLKEKPCTVELPSFLEPEAAPSSEVKVHHRRRSSRKRSQKFETDMDGPPAEVKLMRSAKRRSGRVHVSPDSFVKDMSSTKKSMIRIQFSDKEVLASVASPHKPLNDSVGQSSLLDQLKNIKSFIHEKSFEIEKNISDSFSGENKDSVKELERRETFVKRRTSPRFSLAGQPGNIRRGTFVTDATKMKLLETQKPSEASPRRTTFTVLKNGKKENMKSPMRSRSEGSGNVTDTVLNIQSIAEDLSNARNSPTREHEIVETIVAVNTATSETVPKDGNPGFPSRISDTDASSTRRLFSADSLENDSFEKQFDSPKRIAAEPNEEYNRRATLTVTKSRPSDALLDRAHRKCPSSLLLGVSPKPTSLKQNISLIPETENINENAVDALDGSHVKTEEDIQKSSQNSTFEISSSKNADNVSEISFPLTPYQLPVSPNPNHSRRSTHVIEKPRMLDISKVDRKQLFTAVGDAGELCETSVTSEVEKCKSYETSEDAIKHTEETSVCDHSGVKEVIQDKDNLDLSSPSMNTRRKKLSAKKSIASPEQASQEKREYSDKEQERKPDVQHTEAEVQQADQLFFIALDDNKQVREVPKIKQTARKDPKQFLKKRSSSQTQADDLRTKKVKSNPTTDLSSKAKQTITTQPRLAPKATRQICRSTGSINTRQNGQPLKPNVSTMKGLAQSKLILVKKSKTALPKHPLPFAAKNMYYDERWMEKQERGFVNWLNFILTPAEEYQSSEVKVKVDAGKLSVDVAKSGVKLAPTNEALSLRAYSAHRKLNRLRKSACRLFQSESVIRVIQKIEAEVESHRLAVRKDKMLHADLGIKQRILDMLLSFNPLWLRIGMETIYGEVVPLQSNNDVYGLSRFIVTRLLSSPDIALEFAHPTVPHLYRDGYAVATAQHTLKKFLMLVYFLDRAKEQRLIDHNPCLFCKDSDFKTSKDLLLQFSRDCLAGEGDITRHLSYLGYKVTYTQTALDEFDFAVSKLSTDLRDGLRLTRVLEFLCNKPELSRTLRAPAISRLQKVHNVEVVFKTLTQQGLETGKVTPRDVVDGHREKTLQLLWTIILHYQVELLLNEAQLREEVDILQRSLRVKNQLSNLLNYEQKLKSRRESREPDLHTQNERLNLLLKWCRSVCAFYNIKIENFTVSFSDGRALCHILHYYHPALLPRESINNETTMTHMEDMERNGCRDMTTSFNDSFNSSAVFGDVDDPEVFQQLLNNEKENFKILFEKVKELGGVPLMLKWTDMSNTIPDEKVVVTYLLYLCARLLDIRHESRAARVIQMAWRKYRLKNVQEEMKIKSKSASVIQRAVREFLRCRKAKRHQAAAICIQRVWRGHKARMEAKQLRRDLAFQREISAICLLQRAVRAYLYRCRYLHMRASIILVQAHCRGFLLRRKLSSAATTIQRAYRNYVVRKRFQEMRASVVRVQACVRGYLTRQRQQKRVNAATVIQRGYRGQIAMKEQRTNFKQIKKSCTTIQRCWRKYVTNRNHKMTSAAIKIQSAYRGHLVRKHNIRLRVSVIKIQAAIRGHLQKKRFARSKKSATMIQRWFRNHLVAKQQRHEYQSLREAVIFMQSRRRMVLQQRTFHKTLYAVVVAQSSVRMFIAKRKFEKLKTATVAMQKLYRAKLTGRACRYRFLVQKGAAMTLQATYRGHLVRKEIRQKIVAVTHIQSITKGYLQRKMFLRLKNTVITCQRRFRAKMTGRRQQENFLKLKNAAVVCQKLFRGRTCRQAYLKSREQIIKVQSLIRMVIKRRSFMSQKKAAIVCQQRYRAMKIGRICRRQFLVASGAAITIQALYRGHIVRKEIQKQRKATVLIQANCRQFIQRRRFTVLKKAAVMCQRMYRSKVIAIKQRHKFLTLKKAAVTLQAVYRGHRVRNDLSRRHEAATIIQSHCRRFIEKQRFARLKSAAIVCQRMYRSMVIAIKQRHKFLTMKKATVTLQAVYRGHRVRNYLSRRHEAATIIQSHCRRFIEKQKFARLKSAAMICQRMYRSKVIGNQQRCKFLTMKYASVRIQASFRGHRVRKDLSKKHEAAVVIQSAYRKFVQKQKFDQLNSAAVVCQNRYRAKVIGEAERYRFVAKRIAAVKLQAVFKGFSCRKKYLDARQKIIKLQSHVRGHQQKQKYQKLRQATLVIQRRVRETLAARQQMAGFLQMKSAAILIQSSWKMVQQRDKYVKVKAAIIIAQSCVRGFLQRQRFHKLKMSALTLQKFYRAKMEGEKCRRQYLIHKGAAMTIQAIFRGYLVRKDMQHKHRSATLIQSHIRCYLQRKKYLTLKSAAIACQRKYRSKVIGRNLQGQFQTVRKGVVCLQAVFRGRKCRKEYLRSREAATKIQSVWRMRNEVNRFARIRNAAVAIQQWYRGAMVTREAERGFLIKKGAAITIQARIRGYLTRTKYLQMRAARKIQTAYRMFMTRKKYLQMRTHVILCQTIVRGYLARKHLADLRKQDAAAYVIQKRWQASRLAARQRTEFLKLKDAAIVIQTQLRTQMAMQKCRRDFLIKKGAAVTIQAGFKGYLVRNKIKRDTLAVVKIQSWVREYLCRKQFVALRCAVLTCQRQYRAKCCGRFEQERFSKLKCATVKIQSLIRMVTCRKRYLKCRNSAVQIQSWYRGIIERKHYLKCKWAAIVLQRHWRAELLCRKQVMKYQTLRDAAILAQSLYRAKVARENYHKIKAVIKIQSFYRMTKERRHFSEVRNAAVLIQTQIRSWSIRQSYKKLQAERQQERKAHLNKVAMVMRSNMAAMTIQRCYRNYRVMAVAKEKLHSVMLIQRWMRSKLQRLHYLKDRQRVICIQSCVRSWLARRDRAACVIQRFARKWLGNVEERKKDRMIVKIQAFWRGYRVRKNSKSKKLMAVRRKVQAATAAATEDKKLCNRTSSALDYLLKYKHLSQVLDALMHLDAATRLSWVCCERLVEVNAVTVLYRLVRGCNRSLPHMEIIKYTVNIMLNLAKYEKTRPSLYEDDEGVQTLLELMQIYREKGSIFVKTCTLLGILAIDISCKTNILNDTKTVEKLKSIQKLTARKHKLEENQRVTRAKMNATINATFLVRSPVKKHKIKPDWSLHKDKMNDIENPLKAINFILGNLGISTK